MSWVGFDLDGTLAQYHGTVETIGAPYPEVVRLVRRLIADGTEVRVFTARVCSLAPDREEQRAMVEAWCEEHVGLRLAVTSEKTYGMLCLVDDRAIGVHEGRLDADAARRWGMR